MDRPMRDLNDLACFAAVVRHQGFSPAARALGIPKSHVSRRVARLEEQLGVRLLERSTRKVSATEVGRQYYQHCRAMVAEAEAADEAAARVQAQPQGLVRIGCPNGLSRVLAEVLHDLRAFRDLMSAREQEALTLVSCEGGARRGAGGVADDFQRALVELGYHQPVVAPTKSTALHERSRTTWDSNSGACATRPRKARPRPSMSRPVSVSPRSRPRAPAT